MKTVARAIWSVVGLMFILVLYQGVILMRIMTANEQMKGELLKFLGG